MLWEEKNYILQTNNGQPQKKETIVDIMNETQIKSDIPVCEDTWTRNCPNCNRKVIYKSRQGVWRAKKFNSVCKKCNGQKNADVMRSGWINGINPFKGKSHTKENRLKCINSAIEHSKFGKDNPFFGKKHTEKTKLIISNKNALMNLGINNPFYGKHHTDLTKRIISERNSGRKVIFSEERRKNLSISLSGKPKNDAHKKSLSDSGKNRWELSRIYE